ncbi:hypothetical protein BJ322DRAFT_463498 [Thelephora terrestris]|uniref:F-box domain-containing protein n=1 Tax=Thelephora terrestris TaxID=56493 RepID=A0A9P6L1C1_9AGAM|nr:hypothetical protein BJ322DRAFT_463498 [Thelephora terrestris]
MNMNFCSSENARARISLPPSLSNELFGLFIESLGEDLPSLRACSLVCRVFRHFCRPNLYRNITLDCKEKLDTFFKIAERSDSLIHTKSLSLTYYGFDAKAHLRKPRRILDIVSRKASLEALRLHRVQFHADTFPASLLSKLSAVKVLTLQECHFGGFEDFVTFVRSFPSCQVLRLHRRTWIREPPKPRFRGSPAYDLALTHLEITSTSKPEWGESFCNHGKIVGMPWLNLTGLKSFAYVIEEDTVSAPVLEHIANCELLEEMDMALSSPGGHDFAFNQLIRFIVRIKSLTLRCSVGLLPWFPSNTHGASFPSSSTLERIKIITPRLRPTIEECKLLDATFSDTQRYPSLMELNVCSFKVTSWMGRQAGDTHEQLCLDEHLPRLMALGRLPPSTQPEPAERARPVDTFGSVAGAYYSLT